MPNTDELIITDEELKEVEDRILKSVNKMLEKAKEDRSPDTENKDASDSVAAKLEEENKKLQDTIKELTDRLSKVENDSKASVRTKAITDLGITLASDEQGIVDFLIALSDDDFETLKQLMTKAQASDETPPENKSDDGEDKKPDGVDSDAEPANDADDGDKGDKGDGDAEKDKPDEAGDEEAEAKKKGKIENLKKKGDKPDHKDEEDEEDEKKKKKTAKASTEIPAGDDIDDGDSKFKRLRDGLSKLRDTNTDLVIIRKGD